MFYDYMKMLDLLNGCTNHLDISKLKTVLQIVFVLLTIRVNSGKSGHSSQ